MAKPIAQSGVRLKIGKMLPASPPREGHQCCIGLGKTRRCGVPASGQTRERTLTSPGSTARPAEPIAQLGVRPRRSGAWPSRDDMEFTSLNGQGNVGTLGQGPPPPETDKHGGGRNGHRPRTPETDTPTGDVCTNITIQQSQRCTTESQGSHRTPVFTVEISFHTQQGPLSVACYTAWPAAPPLSETISPCIIATGIDTQCPSAFTLVLHDSQHTSVRDVTAPHSLKTHLLSEGVVRKRV